jgi:hypothetical protein
VKKFGDLAGWFMFPLLEIFFFGNSPCNICAVGLAVCSVTGDSILFKPSIP